MHKQQETAMGVRRLPGPETTSPVTQRGSYHVRTIITRTSEEDVAKMCDIAAIIDTGTFEGAGFEFSAETWKPGRDDCCHLHIRPGTKPR